MLFRSYLQRMAEDKPLPSKKKEFNSQKIDPKKDESFEEYRNRVLNYIKTKKRLPQSVILTFQNDPNDQYTSTQNTNALSAQLRLRLSQEYSYHQDLNTMLTTVVDLKHRITPQENQQLQTMIQRQYRSTPLSKAQSPHHSSRPEERVTLQHFFKKPLTWPITDQKLEAALNDLNARFGSQVSSDKMKSLKSQYIQYQLLRYHDQQLASTPTQRFFETFNKTHPSKWPSTPPIHTFLTDLLHPPELSLKKTLETALKSHFQQDETKESIKASLQSFVTTNAAHLQEDTQKAL